MRFIDKIRAVFTLGVIVFLAAGSSSYAKKGQDGDDFYERKYALVIGNSRYESKPLVNPENDASDISAVLGKTGFRVTTVLNADKAALELAIAKFESALPKRAAVLIFYAGHAVQYQAQNVILPVGSIGKISKADDLFTQGVVLSDLLKQVATRKDSITTVILDACRDSPFPDKPEISGGLSRSAAISTTGKGEAKSRKGSAMEGIVVAFSTAPDMTAADGEGRNSPYTKHLKEFLRRPNTSLDDILKLTRTEVTKETGGQQTPWYETSMNGEFYPAGRGRIEFEDLLKLLVPAKSGFEGRLSWFHWRDGDVADPINWDRDSENNDKPTRKRRKKPVEEPGSMFENVPSYPFNERGEVAILLNGEPTHGNFPVKWTVWLLGVRGGFDEVVLTSGILGFGGRDVAWGFGQSPILEVIPACRNDDDWGMGSRVFKVNLPGHRPSWLAETYSCGAANCLSDYMLFFHSSELKRYGCR